MEGLEGAVLEQEPIVTGGDEGATTQGEPTEGAPGGETPPSGEPDDPYSPKSSREYSQWLKSLRDADPGNAKFAKLSKDNHSRLYQLNQLEPRGIDGVRERYALMDSVVHGELKGPEAVGAIQDELRGIQELDAKLLSGNAEALTEMGEEFTSQALPKLAGPILDMVKESNPEAYASAILPHLVDALRSSDLVSSFNAMVDTLNEKPPAWLPEANKAEWTREHMAKLVQQATRMGQWFNAQEEKAKGVSRGTPQNPGASRTSGQPKIEDERAEFEKEKQAHHWRTNIQPGLDRHASKTFDDLFRPYEKRLKLNDASKADLRAAFLGGKDRGGVIGAALKNPVYMSQLKRYQAQQNPDANTVLNFAKVEWDKHAKGVFQKLIDTRYGAFLSGQPRQAVATPPAPGQRTAPVSPGVQIVTQKPANVDYKRTPLDWLHQKKYYTTDGKIVQVRR